MRRLLVYGWLLASTSIRRLLMYVGLVHLCADC